MQTRDASGVQMIEVGGVWVREDEAKTFDWSRAGLRGTPEATEGAKGVNAPEPTSEVQEDPKEPATDTTETPVVAEATVKTPTSRKK